MQMGDIYIIIKWHKSPRLFENTNSVNYPNVIVFALKINYLS